MSQRLHKKGERARPSQIRMGHGPIDQAFSTGGVTYQLERIKCGKPRCACGRGALHGPYWYAYWKAKGRTRSKYVGKKLPAALVDVDGQAVGE